MNSDSWLLASGSWLLAPTMLNHPPGLHDISQLTKDPIE